MQNDIKRLMREHDELLQKRQAIYDKAIAERRGPTDEEKAVDKRLEKKSNDMAANIDQLKEIGNRRARIPLNQPEDFVSGDEIDIAWANANTRTCGLDLVYNPVP